MAEVLLWRWGLITLCMALWNSCPAGNLNDFFARALLAEKRS